MFAHRPAGRAVAVLLAVTLLGACGASATPSPTTPAPTTPAPTTPSPTANPDEALVNDVAAVWSTSYDAYDAAAIAALYAPEAVIHDEISGSGSATGLEAIQATMRGFAVNSFKVRNTSAPIRQGNYVAVFQLYGSPEASNPGLMVLALKDGKIVSQWMYPAY